jgi:hypothetical protein
MSLNNGIELCSFALDEVIVTFRVVQQDRTDREGVYRIEPVHPQDRALLAVQWEGQVFFNTRLQIVLSANK